MCDNKKLVLYTIPDCERCELIERLIKSNINIECEFRNIYSNREYFLFIFNTNMRSLPVLVYPNGEMTCDLDLMVAMFIEPSTCKIYS